MRFAFAGTPEFGAWVLHDLLSLGRRPELVISQPARPRGRGRKVSESPVSLAAAEAGLSVLTPPDINSGEVIGSLGAARADCLVVAAFGQLLRAELLDALPCINVHASLLPAYRGAAPVHWALRNGELTTGVSIMRIIESLDAGPVAARVSLSLNLWDDGASVGRALALLGALAMDRVLQATVDGTVVWQDQPDQSTYAPKVTTADRTLDLGLSALACHNLVRALVPDTAAEMRAEGLTLRVWRTWPWLDEEDARVPEAALRVWNRPGRLAHSRGARGRLFVGCGSGALEILAVQPAGRGVMGHAEFLCGYGGRLPDCVQVPEAEAG